MRFVRGFTPLLPEATIIDRHRVVPGTVNNPHRVIACCSGLLRCSATERSRFGAGDSFGRCGASNFLCSIKRRSIWKSTLSNTSTHFDQPASKIAFGLKGTIFLRQLFHVNVIFTISCTLQNIFPQQITGNGTSLYQKIQKYHKCIFNFERPFDFRAIG